MTDATGDTNSTGGADPSRDTDSSGSTGQTVHALLLSVLTAFTLLQLAG